jgi:hypothetical protein
LPTLTLIAWHSHRRPIPRFSRDDSWLCASTRSLVAATSRLQGLHTNPRLLQ